MDGRGLLGRPILPERVDRIRSPNRREMILGDEPIVNGKPGDRGNRRASVGRHLRSAVEATEPVLGIESTLTFIVLAILFVPLGLVVLVASILLRVALEPVVGGLTGTLAGILGVGWLLLTLAAIVLVFRTLFRRLPRRVREHAVPGLRQRDADRGNGDTVDAGGLAVATSPPAPPSLAELDARFTPRDPGA
jgi:hypothetical protein